MDQIAVLAHVSASGKVGERSSSDDRWILDHQNRYMGGRSTPGGFSLEVVPRRSKVVLSLETSILARLMLERLAGTQPYWQLHFTYALDVIAGTNCEIGILVEL